MKIYSNSQNIKFNKQSSKGQRIITHQYPKVQSFGASISNAFEMSKKLKISLYTQKTLAKIVGQKSNPVYYNLKHLEGLQKDIKVFDGLSMKQIGFLGHNLHSIMTKRGCYSHCAYCYPNAQKPIKQTGQAINSFLFEDFKSLNEGFGKLQKRSGINFIHHYSKNSYQTLVFDADNIEVAVKDLKGKIHEFPELNKMLYKTSGVRGIFDTSGWSVFSEKHQKRAERIVEYYSNPKNMEELYQFNISINPFHSTLVKVNELKNKGKIEIADKVYNTHIQRLANTLFTCTPIANSEKFSTIKRAFDLDVPNMHGYYYTDEIKILKDVYTKIKEMCIQDLGTKRKYIKSKNGLEETLSIFKKHLEQGNGVGIENIDIDTTLVVAPKLEALIKNKNPQMGEFEFYKRFKDIIYKEDGFERMMHYKSHRAANVYYAKIIDADGKVYLSDNYRVIPTDIQLNFINKDKNTAPLETMVEDFVLTKKMI